MESYCYCGSRKHRINSVVVLNNNFLVILHYSVYIVIHNTVSFVRLSLQVVCTDTVHL